MAVRRRRAAEVRSAQVLLHERGGRTVLTCPVRAAFLLTRSADVVAILQKRSGSGNAEEAKAARGALAALA